jgi:LacI family transcriptional regulator
MYDVARRAGVSAATVSRVLNGRSTVDPSLAERVTAAMTELGYRRNTMARNLRLRASNLWAIIISDVENPFFTSMVRGVEDVASTAGYSVVLCNSDENPAKEQNYLDAAMAEKMAGVIISPSSARVDGINQLRKGRCPVVVVDRELDGLRVDTVLVDNLEGARSATDHLIEQDFQRIACITGPRWLSTAAQRLTGYTQALKAAGRVVDEQLIRYADFRKRGGHEAMASLLDSGPPPDAVFVANNLMTVGAAECLIQQGRAIPGDVALVGFDSIPWADLVFPSLTTVAQPTYEVGRAAAHMLLAGIREPDHEPQKLVLATELQVRASSVLPRR